MTSWETVAVMGVLGVWCVVLMLVASEVIQSIIRTHRGQVEGETLSMDGSRMDWIKRAD